MIQHSFIEKSRNKELFFQLILVCVCVSMGLVIPILAKTSWSFVNICNAIYEQSTTMLFLVTSFMIAPCIVGDRSSKSISWYQSRNQTIAKFILSRMIYYVISVLLPVMFLYAMIHLFLMMYFQARIHIFPVLLLVLSINLFNLALQIFISCVAKNKAVSIISALILWIVLSICNMFVPILRGYVAPYDINSIQHDYFQNILLDGVFFDSNFIATFALPIIFAVILLYVSIYIAKHKSV